MIEAWIGIETVVVENGMLLQLWQFLGKSIGDQLMLHAREPSIRQFLVHLDAFGRLSMHHLRT